MPLRTYIETFDTDAGGWTGWHGQGPEGATKLELRDGAALSRSPWWVDYNHAPPGGGYMHLPYCLFTSYDEHTRPRCPPGVTGPNRFVEGGYPTDFTGARMTVRVKADLEARGAEFLLLAQARVGEICVNQVLTAQPFALAPDWTETTVVLAPDPDQWLCMGSRHDRTDTYGCDDIDKVLRDVNCDIILVLGGIDVRPAEPIDGDPHILRAGEDYAADPSRLPEGILYLDEIRIEFAKGT